MAGKITRNSRYRRSTQILENDGKLIFIPPRRPIVQRNFPDNIVHQVRGSDRLDVISYLYYRSPNFGWVIADFNNLLFGDSDLLEKNVVILPSRNTLLNEILPNL